MAHQGGDSEVLRLQNEIQYLSALISKHKSGWVSGTQWPNGSSYKTHSFYQHSPKKSVNKKWIASTDTAKVTGVKWPHTASGHFKREGTTNIVYRAPQCSILQKEKFDAKQPVSSVTSRNLTEIGNAGGIKCQRTVQKPKFLNGHPLTSSSTVSKSSHSCSTKITGESRCTHNCTDSVISDRRVSKNIHSPATSRVSAACRCDVSASSESAAIVKINTNKKQENQSKVCGKCTVKCSSMPTKTPVIQPAATSSGTSDHPHLVKCSQNITHLLCTPDNKKEHCLPVRRTVLPPGVSSTKSVKAASGLDKMVMANDQSVTCESVLAPAVKYTPSSAQSDSSKSLPTQSVLSKSGTISSASRNSGTTSSVLADSVTPLTTWLSKNKIHRVSPVHILPTDPHSVMQKLPYECVSKSRYKLTRKQKLGWNAGQCSLVSAADQHPMTSTPKQYVKKRKYTETFSSNLHQSPLKWCKSARLKTSAYHWRRRSVSCGSPGITTNNFRTNTFKLNSRYKLVRKAIEIAHRKNTKLNNLHNSKYSYKVPTSQNKGNISGRNDKSHVWTTAFSLKRGLGDYLRPGQHQSSTAGHMINSRSYNSFRFTSASFRGRLNEGKYSLRYRGSTKLDGRLSHSVLAKSAKFSPAVMRRHRFALNWKASLQNVVVQRIPGRLSKADTVQTVASRVLQRSISTAHAKFKKINNKKKIYCLYYNRFGKCHRGNQCHYVHDPARVAICTRFLRGRCEVKNCPFSHQVSKEKMPVCQYFIKGICNRDNCPYLHSNVAKDAKLCEDFIHGFCALGDQCKKKHILICPDYRKSGSCPLGMKCKLKHIKKKAWKKKLIEGETFVTMKTSDVLPGDDFDDVELPLGERKLPAYIPLESSLDNTNNSQITDGASVHIHPRLSFGSEAADETLL